jgi:hypothetical protein
MYLKHDFATAVSLAQYEYLFQSATYKTGSLAAQAKVLATYVGRECKQGVRSIYPFTTRSIHVVY